MRIFRILTILILSVFYTSLVKAECIYKSDLFGKSIGIVGDSFFTTKDGFGNLENGFELAFHTSNVQNSAIGGATVLGFSRKAIRNQKLDKPLDILILGGGGNDFGECGSDKNCLAEKLNSFITPNLKSGAFTKIIEKYSSSDTKSVILYTTIVGNHASDSWKKLVELVASKFAERMQLFAETKQEVIWVDAGKILRPNNKKHWLEDGYHPSAQGYKLIAKELFNRLCTM